MRVYLDTNVLDFIDQKGATRAAKAIFDSRGARVCASELNLLETYRINDVPLRRRQLQSLTYLAKEYAKQPIARQHAQEVRFEIARCRRQWIRRSPQERSIKSFLRNHQSNWKAAQTGNFPEQGVSRYRHDSERGIDTARRFQKTVRGEQVTAKRPNTVISRWNSKERPVDAQLDDPESYWRADCAMAWYEAIVMANQASRDYADYLLPYLREDAFDDEHYAEFWMSDVEADRLSMNRITGLASFFQLDKKISHGNPYDALHANFLLHVDMFMTADKALFYVLTKLHSYLHTKCAVPVLIDRSAGNAPAELEAKLNCMT